MTRGTIVLTPFPFTDLQAAKVRPAVVVSRSDRTGEDVILAFISSVVSSQPLQTDLLIDPKIPENRASGLKVPSVVKCDKLAIIRRRMILGELGAFWTRPSINTARRSPPASGPSGQRPCGTRSATSGGSSRHATRNVAGDERRRTASGARRTTGSRSGRDAPVPRRVSVGVDLHEVCRQARWVRITAIRR